MVDYYSTEDFESSYADCLAQDTAAILERVRPMLRERKWEVEERLGVKLANFSDKQVRAAADYVVSNAEEFVERFSGYYVGHFSLDSVAFGEQEENVADFAKSNGLTVKKAAEMLDAAGFSVINGGAYYIVSGGLHLNLVRPPADWLLEILAEQAG